VTVLTDQQVERLAVENHRVTGVVMRSGETINTRKGVILATGGYGANQEMSRKFEQLPGFAQEASGLAPTSLTGDGLVLAQRLAAYCTRSKTACG
jgi:succinate dehydrogenase/fumarate reductase flavoprotein subunit